MMQRLLLLAALVACPFAAGAQALLPGQPRPAPPPTQLELQIAKMTSVPQLEALAAQYSRAKDFRGLQLVFQRLLSLRPQNSNFAYTLAAAYAEQDMKRESYDTLLKLQASGHAYDLGKDARFAKVHGTQVWDYLVANMAANMTPFGEGKVAHTLPAGDYLFDSVAYDPTKKQLLVGSIREGTVHRIGAKGALEPFISPNAENSLWSVFDIAIDAPRNAVYVASSAITHFKHAAKTDYGRAAVFKFALDTGRYIAKYEPTITGVQHYISSVAVTPKGDVFAADGAHNALYKVEGDSLRLVIANKSLTGIKSLTAGDKALYFADYELGIYGFDYATGQPFEVRAPDKVTLYAVSSLSYWNGHLVAIQNGFPPTRVMRFKLSPDGRSIVGHQPLEASRKEWGTPTRGSIGGNKLYFIANTQRAKYDTYGIPKSDAEFEPTKIFETATDFALDLPGEMRPMVKPAE